MNFENRLNKALNEKDFYSAHQIALSQAQRLQRAGKVEEAATSFCQSIISLIENEAPSSSINDLINHLIALEEQSVPSDDFLRDLSMRMISHEDYNWNEFLVYASHHLADPSFVVTCLHSCAAGLNTSDILDWILLYVPEPASFKPICADIKDHPHLLIKAVLTLLIGKYFASVYKILDLIASLNQYPTNPPQTDAVSSAYNLCRFVTDLVSHENPPRELFTRLQLNYPYHLSNPTIKPLWDQLREAYWPKPKAAPTNAANPLASMLQSMMMK